MSWDENELLVAMSHVSKSFPGVKALDDCQLTLRRGEGLALVGENGAGKSTLMKCLSGIYQPDEGDIRVKGENVTIGDPVAASGLGIGMIHQELNLIPHLSVAENIFIGRERKGLAPFMVDHQKQEQDALKLMAQVHLDVDPATRVGDLTVAMQQLVEIIRAISLDTDILIMDEPTASLTDREIDDLFDIIAQLKAKGKGIIYISHRMEELSRISDRITIMRDGRYIDTVATSTTPINKVIAMMVGRELYAGGHEPKKGADSTAGTTPLLEVRGLVAGKRVKGVSFLLQAGEILGIAGLVGAGRTEMARCLFGADSSDRGEILVRGQKQSIKSPGDAVRAGISYLSEDRKRYGFILDMDIAVNTVLATMVRFCSKWGLFKHRAATEAGEKSIAKLRIKAIGTKQRAGELSGGNQQKVVIGKWLLRDADIFIFDEPTRGIDIGAKDEIYRLLDSLCEQGKGIVMISSELPEILRMSHRVLVMCDGRVTGEFDASEATQEKIMACAVQFA